MNFPTPIPFAVTAALAVFAAAPTAQAAVPAVPGEIIVGYTGGTGAAEQDSIAVNAGTNPNDQVSPRSQVVTVAPGDSTAKAIARLKASRGVKYAVPNVIAHAAGYSGWVPNDFGRVGRIHGWGASQWNFLKSHGIDAPDAWLNLIKAGRPGASGVKIAVIDSGIAFRNWGRFRKSPDFQGTRFANSWDFIHHSIFALDRNGHGTHVAGTIAESANNRRFLTGLAYGATIMPLRVLDSQGSGDSSNIAAAIRYAADHGAKVINLSIEFDPGTTAAEIPDVVSAINYATGKGALVVAAAGNDMTAEVTYPARTDAALAVGATTEHRCLADYSNYGIGLDIVAPGGGADADIPADKNCRPHAAPGRDIVQLGIARASTGAARIPYRFTYDAEDGTSMATPHVSATAAMVIASGVLGPHPTVQQVRDRLTSTADPTSLPGIYGAGLLDAGRATDPGA